MTDLEFAIFKTSLKQRLKTIAGAYRSDDEFEQQAAISRKEIELRGSSFEEIMRDLSMIKGWG